MTSFCLCMSVFTSNFPLKAGAPGALSGTQVPWVSGKSLQLFAMCKSRSYRISAKLFFFFLNSQQLEGNICLVTGRRLMRGTSGLRAKLTTQRPSCSTVRHRFLTETDQVSSL